MSDEAKIPVPEVAAPAVGPVCATCAYWRCAEHRRTGTMYDPSGTVGKLRVDGHIRDDDGRDGGTVSGVCHLEPVPVGAESTNHCSQYAQSYWSRS